MKRSLFLQSVLLLAIFSISDQAIPALRGRRRQAPSSNAKS